MESIENIIKKANIENVCRSKFLYEDSLPENSSFIEESSSKFVIMKYYEGTITREEHDKFKASKESFVPMKVYDWIFFINDNGLDGVSDNNLNDEVIDLYLCLSEKSQYKEHFEKLIFILYCSNQDDRFKDIALNAYRKYWWAKNYINMNLIYSRFFLSEMSENENFQKEYGIEIIGNESENTLCKIENQEVQPKNEDWILQKFGGD